MTTAGTLDDFQRDFVAALLGHATSATGRSLATQPGFAVYRNTVLRGCIDALAANHPTVLTLVGAEWFEEAAGRFARADLPRDGSLAAYGEGFAEFLEAFAPAAGLDYLGGVARLDRAWTEAHLAADAPVLAASSLVAVPPTRLIGAILVPHPATRWVASSTFPIYTIWRRHREHAPLDDELGWHGEGGLLTRPGGAVVWRALDASAATFLDACAQGRPFGVAAGHAFAEGRAAGIDTWLPALVAAGAFTRLEEPGP
jgi:Putative DNA-binding domain